MFQWNSKPDKYLGYYDRTESDILNEIADVYNCSIYNNIREMTVDGEEMIFFPKVYVKHSKINGNPAWCISDHPRKGYHLHPAFYDNGVETNTGILIGKHPASVEKEDGSYLRGSYNLFDMLTPPDEAHRIYTAETYIGNVKDVHSRSLSDRSQWDYQWFGFPELIEPFVSAKNSDTSNPDKSGWHLFTVYEHSLLVLLAFIAVNTSQLDCLEEPFGLERAYDGEYANGEWLYGAQLVWRDDNSYFWRVLNNTQSGLVDTAAEYPSDKEFSYSYASTFFDIKEAGYDLGDLFLPKDIAEYDDDDCFFGDCPWYTFYEGKYDEERPYESYPYIISKGISFQLHYQDAIRDNANGAFYAAFCRLAKYC